MKTMTRRPVPDNNLIKSVRKLGPLCGLSGPALVIVLLFSWFLASCGTVSKQSQPLPPDFGLSTSPGTLTIAQGSNGSSTITRSEERRLGQERKSRASALQKTTQ